ncbi:MAG TPA: prepilin peptidase [Rhizomicrobium sp.]|nr:prepilin peptidase [Rhizomicrobium sp.]
MPDLIEALRWTTFALFAAVLGFAAFSDVRERKIPNWTVLAVVLLFVFWALAEPAVSLVSSLEAALLLLVVTVPLFAFRLIGAGDSKLVTAVALFMGLRLLPEFLFTTVVAGGVLAIFSLLMNPRRAAVMVQTRFRADYGRGIPYGVAIALGGVATVLRHMI